MVREVRGERSEHLWPKAGDYTSTDANAEPQGEHVIHPNVGSSLRTTEREEASDGAERGPRWRRRAGGRAILRTTHLPRSKINTDTESRRWSFVGGGALAGRGGLSVTVAVGVQPTSTSCQPTSNAACQSWCF